MEPADWSAAEPWRRPCSRGLVVGSALDVPVEFAVDAAAYMKGLTMAGGCSPSCGAVLAV